MAMPTPIAFTGTISVGYIETAQGHIQAARDYYQAAFNATTGTGPVRTNIISGCGELTALITFAEGILSQTTGTLAPVGGTGKGV